MNKDLALTFACKPSSRASHGKSVNLLANMYQLNNSQSNLKLLIEKYHIVITPEVPDNSKLINKLTKLSKDVLNEKLKTWMPVDKSIYSRTLVNDTIKTTVSHEDVDYNIEFNWSKSIKHGEQDYFQFLNIFFKQTMRKVSFEQIGRNCFDPTKKVVI